MTPNTGVKADQLDDATVFVRIIKTELTNTQDGGNTDFLLTLTFLISGITLHITMSVKNSTFFLQCIYAFCMDMRTNKNYFPIPH
jgi:hypothetical protein